MRESSRNILRSVIGTAVVVCVVLVVDRSLSLDAHQIAMLLFKSILGPIGFVGTTTALIMGGLAAAGSIGGSAISAHAAGSAAKTQMDAAAQIRQQALDAAAKAKEAVDAATATANTGLGAGSEQGNAVIQQTLQQQMAALKPYIDAGVMSLGDLQQMFSSTGPLAGPGSQFSFTGKDYANSPEFAFIQQQANQALQRSAAAQGSVLGGGEVRASDRLNTGLTSTYLDQAFNRALASYNTNRQNLLTRIQGLTNITGLGFNATGAENQDLGNAGTLTNTNIMNTSRQQAANLISAGTYGGNVGLDAARIAAGATAGAANAGSAAQIAQGNAIGSGLSGVLNTAGLTYGLMNVGSAAPIGSAGSALGTAASGLAGVGGTPVPAPGTGAPSGYDPATGTYM